MSVMATFLPVYQARPPPTAMASVIQAKLCMPGHRKVTRVATTMPAPAHTIPPRAVTGELMRFSPRIKSTAATK